ncbi:MAG TPA: alpha-mannosidase [Erysipelothrix sp.]|nr:alpha-mannosidase [Erysipelothrix sp.]
MKKTVHIISHTHWDREWYMAFEQHRMRLVELFEDLFDLFENDPDFDSFHLDGQTILIDDFLEVSPDKKDLVQKYIDEGKLKIGPFYILQDDYLISAEANTRNTNIGLAESKKWGVPIMLGYFPDTFGNMGQAPQMMTQSGIDTLAFGRGVKTTGFNNVVVDEEYATEYSEMWWEGSDGTKALSILFANWYSNGNEIPTEKDAAIAFWDQKLADVENFASTNQLLMMNGVDHQPVQKDVTEAIKLANELYPEYEFIHSNFDKYMSDLKANLNKDEIGSVKGELTSQETDGWYTLTNTASSRIYLKQANTTVQNSLELITEPLALFAKDVTGKYPHDMITFAWKTLLQNHPHDSICGCSIDPVHREMETRFEKAEEVSNFVRDEALRHLGNNIDTTMFDENAKPFTVFNTLSFERKEVVEMEIEWERLVLGTDLPHNLYNTLNDKEVPSLKLVDKDGNSIPFEIMNSEVRFDYDLPKDSFRIPFMARFIKVRFEADIDGFGWETFALTEGEANSINKANTDIVLENDFIKVDFNDKGVINVLNKETNKLHEDFFYYENTGDIGNEYIYRQSADNSVIKSTEFDAKYEVVESNDLFKQIKMIQTWHIPKSADDLLTYEQVSVTEMRIRKAERSSELVPYTVETTFTLRHNDPVVKVDTHMHNTVKDHRIRAVFDTGLNVDTHVAESIFEVIERPNKVSDRWENPENPQRKQAFMNMHDDVYGLTLMNHGIHEYEVLDNRYVAVTILRATGEMGDWGHFPTPEAQCLDEYTMNLGFMFTNNENRNESYRKAYAMQVPMQVTQVNSKKNTLNPKDSYLDFSGDSVMVTALKASDDDNAKVLRFYNLSSEEEASFELNADAAYNSNLIEEKQDALSEKTIKPAEIKTILL